MQTKRQQLFFMLLSVLGLGALVALYFSQNILAFVQKTTTAPSDTLLAEGKSCTPDNQDYLQLLENQPDGEVFTAGCGGMF